MLTNQIRFPLASRKVLSLLLVPGTNQFSNLPQIFEKSEKNPQSKDENKDEQPVPPKGKNIFQKFLSDIKKSKGSAVQQQKEGGSQMNENDQRNPDEDISKFVQQLASNPQQPTNYMNPIPFSGKKSKKGGSDNQEDDSVFNIETPSEVACIPLYKVPIFPTTIVPLIIRNKDFSDYLKKIHKSNKDKGLVGLFLAKPNVRVEQGDKPVDDLSQVYTTGTLGKITYLGQIQKNTCVAVISGIRRIKVKDEPQNSFKDINDRLRVKIEERKTINKELLTSEQETDQSAKLKALILELLSDLKKLSKVSHYHRKEMIAKFLEELFVNDPEEVAYITTVLTSASPEEHQQILERDDITGRLEMAIQMVQKEIQTEFFRTKLSERMMEAQKKNVLHEQLRFIKEELGMGLATNRFRERIASRNIPPKVMKVIEEEMNKLEATDSFSPDHAVISNYVDWLTKLPWGIYRSQTLDVEKAQQILEEDHYGMKNVKERILEYIAVAKLKKGDFKGKIVCLVGPPGVGKTSVGQSIARALNREFFRFSVGGMNYVSELKGHRRTYVGAMPGKFIQIFKQAQSQNPVIMIDEIDKMGNSQIHGDPAAAMLEVLDPEQNTDFLDHFLDVPFDLSKTLFILTANDTSTIPKPLLDRVEVIDMNGYTAQEKLQIAKQYLVPKVEKENGMADKSLKLDDRTILKLIGEYCREAGVRYLQLQLEKLYRKVALKIEMSKIEEKKKRAAQKPANEPKQPEEAEKEPEIKIEIKGNDIYQYLGKPKFLSDRFYEKTPPGVVMGLAWTPMGGALLFIESTAEPCGTEKQQEVKFSRNIRTTGGLGDVMKESTEIAYTYARKFFKEAHHTIKETPDQFPNLSQYLSSNETNSLKLHENFFDNSFIHMHFPEGAIRKDGPSAGVSMVTSLISLALDRPARHNLAMTGEITLTGKVLPVGGIKEKTLGGLRAGVKEIIFPKENKRDWDELEAHVKGDLKVHFVDTYLDVFKIAFDYETKENDEKIAAQQKAEL